MEYKIKDIESSIKSVDYRIKELNKSDDKIKITMLGGLSAYKMGLERALEILKGE